MMKFLSKVVGQDVFGVDFGFLPDGRIIVFEADSTMKSYSPEYFNEFPYLVASTNLYIKTYHALLKRKL